MHFDEFLGRIPGKRKKNGVGWMFQCPGHDDRTPSLSVSVGDDGRILLFCHSGCATERVVHALGLEVTDLFAEPLHRDGPAPDENPEREVARYAYTDPYGKVIYEKIRYEPKSFRITPKGVEKVPYRLHELLNAGGRVFYVEGEKDVDALVALGFVATTSGGVNNWKKDFAKYFGGCDVIVIPDNDEPGRAHAEKVAECLRSQKNVRSVQIVELPIEKKGGDVSDWLSAGGTRQELLRLVDGEGPAVRAGDIVESIRADSRLPRIESPWPLLDEIVGNFRVHTVTVVNGGVGSGKTAWAVQFAAFHSIQSICIYWAGELTLSQICSRLISQSLGVSWRHVIDGLVSDERMTQILSPLNLWLIDGAAEDDPTIQIRQALRQARNTCRGTPLIICDYAQLLATSDENLRTSMGRAMRSLEALVKEENAVAMVLSQANRAGGKLLRDAVGSASDLVDVGAESGSIEQKAANVIALAYEQADGAVEHDAVIAVSKARFGERKRLGMRFHGPTGLWKEMAEGELPMSLAEKRRREEIRESLRQSKTPLSKNEIRERDGRTWVTGRKQMVNASIDALVDGREVFRTALGKYEIFDATTHTAKTEQGEDLCN